MVYLSCMTTTTSSSEPYRICCLCNEDRPADAVIHTGVGTICADQYACEVRQGQRLAEGDAMPEADDFGPDPEDAAPAHLDGDPDEGHMYPDDGDGYYDTDGWD